MLIDKGLLENDVVSLKLVSGEELIAKFSSETTEEIKISKPLTISLGPSGLGMMPWVFLGEKEVITLKKLHVLTIIPSKEEAAKQYLEGTTGIALR